MNLIMPAEFEKRMKEIDNDLYSYDLAKNAAISLMCETLDSLGYEAGTSYFNKNIRYVKVDDYDD